jgi:NADPH-dependent 2,4-dienoyl-CoA reductase/sulfur reductase-like enzyme
LLSSAQDTREAASWQSLKSTSLKLRPDVYYHDKAIDFRPGAIAEAIDAEARTVPLRAGEFMVGKQLIASGKAPKLEALADFTVSMKEPAE